MRPITEVERAVLTALVPLRWASDRDLRALLADTAADPWAPSLASRLRRLGWIKEVRDPANEVARAWRITESGRAALKPPPSADASVPAAPELTVWTWIAGSPPKEAWVSLDPPAPADQPDAHPQQVPAPTAKVLQTWYFAAKKARRLLAGNLPEGTDLRWPTVSLWVWLEICSDHCAEVCVSPVRVADVPHLEVPLPNDPAWADNLCQKIAQFAVARAGVGGAVNALASLVRQDKDANRQARTAAQEADRRAAEVEAARRNSYPVTTSSSVRAIPAGLPTLGRRHR